jgi:putative methionine-R-sulfoxide reductase with GAF domain
MSAKVEKFASKDLLAKLRTIKNVREFTQTFLWAIAKGLEASQGAFFIAQSRDGIKLLSFTAGYAYHIAETETIEFEYGEGLSGQVAKEGKLININTVPDGYISILSGLGQATPTSIIIFPLKKDDEVIAVIELASFNCFDGEEEDFLREIASEIAPLLDALISENQ